MTQADWERVLARAVIGGDEWHGYAYWLRDEADDPGAADALGWLVAEEKYPCWHDSKTWLWVHPKSPRVMVMGKWIPTPAHAILAADIYAALTRPEIFGSKSYRTRTAAMLAAISAGKECGKRVCPHGLIET